MKMYSLLSYHVLPAFLKTSCFEKITIYAIETMFMTLLIVQMNKAQRREPTNQAQIKLKL